MIFKEITIQAAIFDMDGTMFDTERLRFTTLRLASAELFGETISDEILIGSLGLTARKAEELAKSRYGEHYPYRHSKTGRRTRAGTYSQAWGAGQEWPE